MSAIAKVHFQTSKKRTTSLQWTKWLWLVPMCPLFGGSTVSLDEGGLTLCRRSGIIGGCLGGGGIEGRGGGATPHLPDSAL